ncbi:MAG: ParB/RepB/Spo0J family partition protein [Ignavibacteriales bacterium]|nr:ParB/RepB/Spo0J family partition protein [Ignavibacteriales bacterium]
MNGKTKEPLGRGLAALIRPVTRPEIPQQKTEEKIVTEIRTENISEIEIAKISPNPFQPRKDFNQEALDELKQSIQQHGVIQPITVRKISDEKFQLISGERRLRACQELGKEKIPAYVMEVHTDEQMLEFALIENLQREHLNPIEVAVSYQRLIDECKLTHEQVSEKVGKSRTAVTNNLRLLKLPQTIQDGVREGKISEGHARGLAAIPTEMEQLVVFNKVIKFDLSVRKVEQIVQELNQGNKLRTRVPKKYFPPNEVEEKLRNSLGTKVMVKQKAKGNGEIVVEYYSPDDLERLIELLAK